MAVSRTQGSKLAVEMMDKIFLTMFARYRRQLGDSGLNAAWVRAVGKVSGFLILPMVAISLVAVISVYLATGWGTPADHMRWGKFGGGIGWLVVAFLLQARFSKYLQDLPTLPQQESPTARRLVLRFRVFCFGIFAATCATGFVLHEVGLSHVLGF
jgi:hypothetical protein